MRIIDVNSDDPVFTRPVVRFQVEHAALVRYHLCGSDQNKIDKRTKFVRLYIFIFPLFVLQIMERRLRGAVILRTINYIV